MSLAFVIVIQNAGRMGNCLLRSTKGKSLSVRVMGMRGIETRFACEHLCQSQRQLYDSEVLVLSTEYRYTVQQ